MKRPQHASDSAARKFCTEEAGPPLCEAVRVLIVLAVAWTGPMLKREEPKP